MSFFTQVADHRDARSLASRLRRKRFALFTSLIAPLPQPITILDVGGTQQFWDAMRWPGAEEAAIVLLNPAAPPSTRPGVRSMVGDARDLRQFQDGAFDVVFSNSVIEHVGGFHDQQRMAAEVQRVGRRYLVQTPNRFFPIEPHVLVPGFQFLPVALRVFLVRHAALGWYPRIPDRQHALEAVQSIRLLTARELLILFPGGTLYRETWCGLTKSFVIYGGFGR